MLKVMDMDSRDVRRRAPQATSAKIEAVATASAIIDFLAESEQPVGVRATWPIWNRWGL